MKTFILLTTLFLTFSSQAKTFSAFADGDKLYITMLLDSCNGHAVDLAVDGLCKDDRLTKNYATHCGATMIVTSTQMYCEPMLTKPVTFELSLKESNIAAEAKELTLRSYSGEQITIELD